MRYEESQKRHAIKRAYERYGIVLSNEKYNKLLSLVKEGFASTVLTQTNNSSILSIDFEGKKLFFVFNKNFQTIVTFLTFDIVKRYCRQAELKKQKTKGQKIVVRDKLGELIWWDDERKIAYVYLAHSKFLLSYKEINFYPTEEEVNSLMKKTQYEQTNLANNLIKPKYSLVNVNKEFKENNNNIQI
jgi:hypothetical protein